MSCKDLLLAVMFESIIPRFRPTTTKTRCFCGKSENDYNEHGPAICNMKCSGDDDLICGGFGAMNVFSV